jgi:hypothetical protein
MGYYDFPGETWAGDGSAHKGVMAAGSVCFQRPVHNLEVQVGRVEEGISSLRPELAAIALLYKPSPWRQTCSICATARPPLVLKGNCAVCHHNDFLLLGDTLVHSPLLGLVR